MKGSELSVVDFHTHILPCADHGSDSLSTSLAQLRLAKSASVDRIVATSHFYPHRHNIPDYLERRNNAYKLLKSGVDDNTPTVRLGTEVLMCNGIERLDNIDKLCLFGTKTLLLELPFTDFQPDYYKSAYKLCSDGYRVVLAHADRYSPDNVKKMTDAGALIQLNADSLSRLFVPKHLFSWLDKGLVVALGSDIHMVDKNAYKRFSKAKARLNDYLGYIAEQSDKIWAESLDFDV